jgi:putative nucleotidyltransferase with HDIG domain
MRKAVSPEILTAFDREGREKSIREIRITAVVASISFLLFNILDWYVFPDFSRLFLLIRLSVLVFNIIIALITLCPRAYRVSYLLKMSAYLVYSASIITMIHLTGGYLSSYYAGVNIVLIGFMVLLPLDAVRTIVVCVFVYLGYLIPILVLQEIRHFDIFLNNNFFILTTILFSITSSYLSDRINLREFASRYNLARANQDLKKLDKMKTQFFANVSHEVRTPLTSIIAPLQSLRQGDVGKLNVDQNELLDQMHRNAVRLLDLINQMLDFSKLEAGKAHLRLALMDIVSYTGDIVSLFKEVTIRKGIDLSFEESDIPERRIYIDSDRYERIITNLIRNAIKFTETGGITVALKHENKHIVLTVSDTGIGIPESYLPTIFKRFEQVDNSSSRSFACTGLGLAIVEESVQLLHGKIHVGSVYGMGTVFTVRIPDNLVEREPDAFVERRSTDRRSQPEDRYEVNRRNDERRKNDYSRIPISDLAQVESQTYSIHSGTARKTDVKSSGRRILLAEDTDDLRHYIGKILANLGHDVVTTENGLAAWEILCEKHHIDMLVSDIMMPKVDGYELLKRIRSSDRLKHLPVILITAKSGDDPKLRALGIGADDYLPKPINVRELDARIRNILSTRDLRKAVVEARMMDRRIEELMMSFAQTLEIRDAETGNHSKDVLEIGTKIALELGMKIDNTLKASLLLHDIGKIGIPDQILLKPSKLNEDEMSIMKQHPSIGKKLLESFSNFKEVSEIILSHQEHYDGTGYPDGIAGKKIPRISRIIAVADAYHAMTNTRRYRKALSREEAIEELQRNRGSQFDPEVVDAFVRTMRIS